MPIDMMVSFLSVRVLRILHVVFIADSRVVIVMSCQSLGFYYFVDLLL